MSKINIDLRFQDNCNAIEWDEIPRLLKEVNMSSVSTEEHRISFENSYSVIFVFDSDMLIGFGRAISDGIRQAAIYDVALDRSYQGKGIGRQIVQRLMDSLPGCNFILYASPGKEDFYRKMSFRQMKTAMGLFYDLKRMENKDFFFDR